MKGLLFLITLRMLLSQIRAMCFLISLYIHEPSFFIPYSI
jgi:hypothetical protein